MPISKKYRRENLGETVRTDDEMVIENKKVSLTNRLIHGERRELFSCRDPFRNRMMDKEQKGKITSNLTFLKERLGFLDPILDRLVEKNIISFDQREKIENVYPCTTQKKFNEFISILLASPSSNAFPAFLQALEEEGYYNITEKLTKDSTRINSSRGQVLQPTTARIGLTPQHASRSFTEDQKNQAVVEHKTVDVTKTEILNGSSEGIKMAELQRLFSDLRGKLTSDLLEGFEKQRQQEKMEQEISFERKRLEDRVEFELKMEEKLQCLRNEFRDSESSLYTNIERNQELIADLHEKVKQYKESSESYNLMKDKHDQLLDKYEKLSRKYNDLQQSYKTAKEVEVERFETLRETQRENGKLKKECGNLEGRVQDMTSEIRQLKKEKREIKGQLNDQYEIKQLLAEKDELERELDKTKSEVADLWHCVEKQEKQIDSQAEEIQRLRAVEQEKCAKDNKEYEDTVKRQNERIEELFEEVRNMKEKQNRTKTIPQKQFRLLTKNKN
ncbi:hypothetical protein KUTeg_013735 [Tegillarca granosa]|uniref:CARD domain-containing protein n=1 Tax=Tegillarca granosa TaxID=220873 RepID=A0ABQ9EY32_TEGGR|nr:hypothetical protein KUTeg_013735 [Tegillarca granosa]